MDPKDQKLFDESLKRLNRQRAVIKRKITNNLKSISEINSDYASGPSKSTRFFTEIDIAILEVKKFDQEIIDLMIKFDLDEFDEEQYLQGIDSQSEYFSDLVSRMALYSPVPHNSDNREAKPTFSGLDVVDVRPPPLKCGTFYGNDSDRLEYANFIRQFRNVFGDKRNLSSSAKLAYLQSYLKGYALRIVGHLSLTNQNYEAALELLDKEFLDIPAIIDEIYSKVLFLNPRSDLSYQSTKEYLAEIKSHLFDLQNYELDFLVEDSPGYSFMGYLIFSKLDLAFKLELIHRVGNNFPTLNDIFDNCNDVVKVLLRKNSSSEKKPEFELS